MLLLKTSIDMEMTTVRFSEDLRKRNVF